MTFKCYLNATLAAFLFKYHSNATNITKMLGFVYYQSRSILPNHYLMILDSSNATEMLL